MPATRSTARASKSTRSAGIASHFASHWLAICCFPDNLVVCSDPISPTPPVFITGPMCDEPAVPPVVAAGFVFHVTLRATRLDGMW